MALLCEQIGFRRIGKSNVITFKAGSLSKTTAGDKSFINVLSTKTRPGEEENGGDASSRPRPSTRPFYSRNVSSTRSDSLTVTSLPSWVRMRNLSSSFCLTF